jgi:DNA-directed RNA polymerase subunit RPC12/RpoP
VGNEVPAWRIHRLSFLKECPECKHRFHVKLEEKAMTGTERVSNPVYFRGGTRSYVTTNIKDYRFTYKCERCGHEWSETGIEEEPEKDKP